MITVNITDDKGGTATIELKFNKKGVDLKLTANPGIKESTPSDSAAAIAVLLVQAISEF